MAHFIGEIIMFGGTFAPRGWALCNGQQLSIQNNQTLFSILGTLYGGDGRTTFGLPDLRGRTPIHVGQGPGLSNRLQGKKGGRETVHLTANQLPMHSHSLQLNNSNSSFEIETTIDLSYLSADIEASSTAGNSPDPEGRRFAKTGFGDNEYTDDTNHPVKMDSNMLTFNGLPSHSIKSTLTTLTGDTNNTGSGAGIHIMNPYLPVNYIIATDPSFPYPSRN